MAETPISVLDEKGAARRKRLPDWTDEEFVDVYRRMVEIRTFDRRMLELQRQGRIGFYGPVKGQEGSVVGCFLAAREQDWIVPALREGAMALMRGLPLTEAVCQLIGNGADLCKGRQMPCHYTWRAGRYVAMSSVIGTQISHAAGLAMACRYKGTDEAVLGFMGDGATSSNDFHAGLNMAAVRKAPVVFVCQNNQWSISVPVSKQTRSETIAAKAKAYGMPGQRVDGNDPLAVYQIVRGALDRARAGEGPTFVEAVTYRQLGHSSSDDPTRYRDEAEVETWLAKDPIARYRAFLDQEGLWSDADDEALVDEISGRVNKAIREAEAAPALDRSTMITDVFAAVDPRLMEHYREELES
ncbi:MAG: thiamine pyrophosphate-dependent enzyme [Planctomycetota bacterium]